ncbi:S-adenosyl-L-methionine-dependent methyltransferase, protein [Acrodontium crateriforme]|uniref:S-adenosyl-L-methionine-dependent methyltransferase, protein n=1 Tax=Acrodontium crateriforme TaxID=150365 RepID=A0AAQ3MBX5_9PEZI|nr:S-adenosyl-L-methionine-dependent methyltransferase, protein [Acrodontium crateriforme]
MISARRPAHHVARILSRRAYATAPKRSPRPLNRTAAESSSTRPTDNVSKPAHVALPSTPPKSTRRGVPVWAMAVMSLFGGGLGIYTVLLVNAALKTCPDESVALLECQKDVAARYDETASGFDGEVGLSEFFMGITGLRQKLARQCRGHVLEASCGTGRNIGYFHLGNGREEDAIRSLTFLDLSPAMVDVCKKKWDIHYSKHKFPASLKAVRFVTGSAAEPIPPPPEQKKYDTILQTMGLCSTPDPINLLTNLASHLNESNPNARILLLEHGRSYTRWLNNILDNSAEKHAEIHGCWYNREIADLVEDAARRSGLVVKRERRHHLGTTYVFELGFPDVKSRRQVESNQSSDEAVVHGEGISKSQSTWAGSLWSR